MSGYGAALDVRLELKLAHPVAKLFIGSLSFNATEEKLRQYFERCGKVVSVIIPIQRNGQKPGHAFVSYETQAEAQAAIDQLNETEFMGRKIFIRPYESDPSKITHYGREERDRRSWDQPSHDFIYSHEKDRRYPGQRDERMDSRYRDERRDGYGRDDGSRSGSGYREQRGYGDQMNTGYPQPSNPYPEPSPPQYPPQYDNPHYDR